ncbi:sulfatase [Saccharothrix sp. NRRL B-16348]|uniref:sulfatase-like hydrolase/transferase n=1 Tax=Saccharothrix sp. NRRL B-16348 TaxID=1415542 RepID=UPI0006AEB41F|nr:sulfatase-like hydrolase/transferase [Saccharothrix sp. NRRL B-16348]KOX34404.1 sulfatase [Saccharothrix sp. NRRL B-16348]
MTFATRRTALTALAAVLVLLALLAPSDVDSLTPAAFLRLPVEALLAVVLVLVLPERARRVVAPAGGAVLGVLLVAKALDIGFDAVLHRPFDLVLDWPLLAPAVDYVDVTAGRFAAVSAVVAAVLLTGAVVVLMARSAARLSTAVDRHRPVVTRVVAVLTTVSITLAAPVASHSTAAFVYDQAQRVQAGLRDRADFAAESAVDPFAGTKADELLTSLRGKDVVVAFVESYGRSAVEHPDMAPHVTSVLDAGTRRLAAAGYTSRSAFLTSPTAGGGSWLAQATFLSGLWVDNQQRYRTLLASDRLALGSAFRRAGWRSVGVMPGITKAWPEGGFFGYDRIYAFDDLGYHGPRFGYATTPDEFTLARFQQLERADEPLMAVIPLLSSHAPWSPAPTTVGWQNLGDGSVFHSMASGEAPAEDMFGRDPALVRADYARTVEYSLNTLVSYVETYGDDDLVLVFLGDHQPAPFVTGPDAGRDVPITIVTRDQTALDRTAPWGWTDGLRPTPDAPVRPMNTFRDQFLSTFR